MYGTPYTVDTRSGKGAVEEIGSKIRASLTNNGFQVKSSTVAPKDGFEVSNPNIGSSEYDRVLFFEVDQFKAESFFEVDLQWEFHLRIFDDKGVLLAQEENTNVQQGIVRNYAGSITTGQAQRAINSQTDEILAQMLSSADIKKALEIQNSKMASMFDENGRIKIKEDGTTEEANIKALRKQLNKAELAPLFKQLTIDDKQRFHKVAKDVCRKGVQGDEYLDKIAEIIWTNRRSNDRNIVRGLSYLCKTIAKSKNPRYRMLFEEVRREGRARYLRKHAIKSGRNLSAGMVEQFKPEEGFTVH